MKRVLVAVVAAAVAAAVLTVLVMTLGLGERATFWAGGIAAAATGAALSYRRRVPVATSPASAARLAPVLGSLCAACAKKIVMAVEGTRCQKCQAPLHTTCATAHACAPATAAS